MAYLRQSLLPSFYPGFWLKTALHLLTPGGYGYIRKLRRQQDAAYQHERDKHEVRLKHHGEGGWKVEKEGDVLKRDYANYEEYLTHQKQKLEEMLKMKGGFSNWDICEFRLKFYQRFKHLVSLLSPEALILCCGARQGTEVEVLHDLGFKNAYGIDLNPGPDNRVVRVGDFMKLQEATNSIDLLYTNCVDHSFDLEEMMKEHVRVLKPDGFLLYDMGTNMEEGSGGPFEAVSWDHTENLVIRLLQQFQKLIRAERDDAFGGAWLWVLLQGKIAENN
ncbi:MAG: methyltransferase domain-containing protein [Verrucomicrobiae bacterium]|nr:methyltransferase domain-containing protein [Verrucomicrobiae bacterium]